MFDTQIIMKKNLLTFALCLLSLLPAFGQGLQRTALTTNTMMNLPSSLDIPIWNATAGKWSNGPVTATAIATNALRSTQTNGVYVVGSAQTNQNFIDGPGITWLATNANGSVTVQGSISTIYSNVTYVNPIGTRYAAGTLFTNMVGAQRAGSLLVVGPGIYDLGGTNADCLTLKRGTRGQYDQYWMPGAVMVYGFGSNAASFTFSDLSIGSTTNRILGYGSFYGTNSGGGGNILYIQGNGTEIEFEYVDAEIWGDGSSVILQEGATGLRWQPRHKSTSHDYDVYYNGAGNRYLYVDAPVGIFHSYEDDPFEFASGFTNRGDCIVNVGHMIGSQVQGHDNVVMNISGSYKGGAIGLAAFTSHASAAYFEVNGGRISRFGSTGQMVDQGLDTTANTSIHFRNVIFDSTASPFDPFLITNKASLPIILENCTILPHASATNWGRGLVTSHAVIRGGLSVDPVKLKNANLTVIGTNQVSGITGSGNASFNTYSGSTLFISGDAGIGTLYATNVSVEGGTFSFNGTMDDAGTTFITSLTEDASPAAGDFIMTYDASAGTLKKVQRSNFDAGGSGGTNFPPVIHLGVSTNMTIGTGVRKSVTITTNDSFALSFIGTALNGEEVQVGVSNYAITANIYMTNFSGTSVANCYDPFTGGNVSSFLIPSNSVRFFTFVWHTNFNLGTVRQELRYSSSKQATLAGGGYTRTSTNGATSVVTVYQSVQVDYIDAGAFLTNATNWAATFHYTNHFQGALPQVFYTFAETATNEAFFRLTAPAEYDGTPVKAKFHWTSLNVTSAKTNTWGILAKKSSGVDFDDSTFGTRVDIRSAHSAGKEFNTSPATGNVTINGSPVGGDLIAFKVIRDPNDANDNVVGLTRLHAVEIQWGLTNAVVASW